MQLPAIITNPTPSQLRIMGGVLLVLALLYYVVVMRPSLTYAFYVLGKKRYGNLDAEYVRSRARAYVEGAQSFEYKGKNYITETGYAQ